MTISPAAENYIYGVMGSYYGSIALGKTENVPSPFEEVERGYFIYPGSNAPPAPRAEVPADYSIDESVDRDPDTDSTVTGTGTPSKLTGTLGKAQSMLDKAIQGYVDKNLAFPTSLNPLTGTVRASGIPGAMASMMPGAMAGLVGFGYKANMANLTNIANIAAYGTPGYNVAMLGNQMVGVSPGIFGGPALSGNIPDNLSYEQAQELAAAIQSAPMTVYGPARAVAMGLSPQATFGLSAISSPPKGYILTPQGEDPSLPGQLAEDGYGNPIGTNQTTTSVFGLELPNYVTTNMPLDFNYSDFINQPNPAGGFTDFSDIDAFGTSAYTDPFGIIGMADESLMDSMPNTPGSGTGTGTPGDPGDPAGQVGIGGGPGGAPDGTGSGMGGYGGYEGDPSEGGYGAGRAMGGRIGYAPGGDVTSGFVNKDPDSVTEKQSIADNRFTSIKEGSFIVNQPTNEKYEGMLDSLVAKAKKKAKKSKDAPMVDVALSDGERHIEPEVVAEIEKMKGKSFLDNLNDKGKAEVRRRQNKYGGGVGLNEGGIAEIDRGLVPQLIGPDRPKISGAPTAQGSGFIDQPPPSIDDDVYFGRKFGDIKSAIQSVEIKGFEDNPFIFTGIKRKGAASSAFGPMQITASTLKDIKKRSKFYKMLGPDEKKYMDLLIQQGDDKVNIEKYRSMYRDGKKINTPKDIRKLYGRYGVGQINTNLHRQYYDTIANVTLMQKLQDHKTLKDALASYGEGTNYANKVLSALK